ncbi:MAG: GntR family transcriptional regulator [Alicyclobacillus sp.]|nr:GntR family transcriptional regulator [Alicyclobacillus sp.]
MTNKLPLYEQIYLHILDQIRNGVLNKGDRVPSEKELAEQFHVSRITSKKALELLAQENIIERVQGRGSFVSQDAYEVQRFLDANRNALESDIRHSWMIGLIVPDFSDAFGSTIVHAVERYCRENGSHLILKLTNGSQEEEEHAIRSLVELGADGLMVMPVHGEMYNAEIVRLVLDSFPLVLIDRQLKGIPAVSVCTDNRKAAHDLTRYLHDLGHEHIAFLSPPPEHTSTIEERIQGFITALSERGLNLNPNYIVSQLTSTLPSHTVPEEVKADQRLLLDFLQENPEITAFVACEYNIALALMQAVAELGKRIPEDYSVVCFDSPGDAFGQPLFTHIRQNEALIGYTAGELLIKQLTGHVTSTNTVINHELVIGKSTRSINDILTAI